MTFEQHQQASGMSSTKENHKISSDGIKRKLNESPVAIFTCSSNLATPSESRNSPKNSFGSTPNTYGQNQESLNDSDGLDLLDMLDEEIENEERREEMAKQTPLARAMSTRSPLLAVSSPSSSNTQEPMREMQRIDHEESISQESLLADSSVDQTADISAVDEETDEPEETEEERKARLEQADIEFCLRLQEEESVRAYQAQQAAVQASLQDDDSEEARAFRLAMELERQEAGLQQNGDESQEEVDPDEMGYEQLLELGEQIGDVAKDMWKLDAQTHINALPTRECCSKEETKCLICQYEFEKGDKLRTLPCSHEFHTECVDEWLSSNKCCPTCKQDIN